MNTASEGWCVHKIFHGGAARGRKGEERARGRAQGWWVYEGGRGRVGGAGSALGSGRPNPPLSFWPPRRRRSLNDTAMPQRRTGLVRLSPSVTDRAVTSSQQRFTS